MVNHSCLEKLNRHVLCIVPSENMAVRFDRRVPFCTLLATGRMECYHLNFKQLIYPMKSVSRKLQISWGFHIILSMIGAKVATDITINLSLAGATNICLPTKMFIYEFSNRWSVSIFCEVLEVSKS